MNIGFAGLLFLVLLTLKLTEVIAWSWWWVTAPLWVGPVALVVLLLSAFVTAVLFPHLRSKL